MVSRVIIRISGLILTFCVLIAVLAAALVYVPNSPLPDAWNPKVPLNSTAKTNILTPYKLRQAINDFDTCQHSLTDLGVQFKVLPNKEVSEQCHIRDQVQIKRLSQARISPLKTTCGTALRLAMWEYHQVQPAAQEVFGHKVTAVNQIGSYNCRAIRSSKGPTQRMSEHATANAVDINGFQLATGKKLTVLKNWNGTPEEQSFLREVRDGGCEFFHITLSPKYNKLHADHFHFDQGRWVSCK